MPFYYFKPNNINLIIVWINGIEQTLRLKGKIMRKLTRITFNPQIMGSKPCIRGMRMTVGTIVGLIASEHAKEKILKAYPYLEEEDINEALAYAEWRVEEIEAPMELAKK